LCLYPCGFSLFLLQILLQLQLSGWVMFFKRDLGVSCDSRSMAFCL
jgi:hypothetical protein